MGDGKFRSAHLSAIALTIALGGCEAASEPNWHIEFAEPALKERFRTIRVRILEESCTGGRLRFDALLRLGAPATGMRPPELDEGTYCFDAQAEDDQCVLFARGETTLRLPDADSIVVVLDPLDDPAPRCSPAQECVNDMCVERVCAGTQADCDGDPTNGCEVDLSNDDRHCGSCGRSCDPIAETCCDGQCCVSRCDSRICELTAVP